MHFEVVGGRCRPDTRQYSNSGGPGSHWTTDEMHDPGWPKSTTCFPGLRMKGPNSGEGYFLRSPPFERRTATDKPSSMAIAIESHSFETLKSRWRTGNQAGSTRHRSRNHAMSLHSWRNALAEVWGPAACRAGRTTACTIQFATTKQSFDSPILWVDFESTAEAEGMPPHTQIYCPRTTGGTGLENKKLAHRGHIDPAPNKAVQR